MSQLTVASSKRGFSIAQYFGVAFLFWAALYLYVPTLPIYTQTKTDDLTLIGVVLAQYGLWQAIIRLPFGIASDWFGWQKPFIILGLVLTGLGAWLLATSTSINGLIIGRAITGLGAATWVPLTVAFSELFRRKEVVQATAMLTGISSLSRLLATSSTGWLNELGGYPLAFYLAVGVAGLAVLLMIPAKESRRMLKPPSLHGMGKLFTRRDVMVPALLNAVFQYAGMASTYGFIPILAKQLGATNVMQSILVTMSIGVFMLGNLAATTIVRRIGSRALIYISVLFMSVGLGIAAVASSLVLVFFAQILTGFAHGAIYPVLMGMSIEQVSDAERSTTMGLHQSVYAIGMFGGPWLSGILAEAIGIPFMFGVTATACLGLGLLGVKGLAAAKRNIENDL